MPKKSTPRKKLQDTTAHKLTRHTKKGKNHEQESVEITKYTIRPTQTADKGMVKHNVKLVCFTYLLK